METRALSCAHIKLRQNRGVHKRRNRLGHLTWFGFGACDSWIGTRVSHQVPHWSRTGLQTGHEGPVTLVVALVTNQDLNQSPLSKGRVSVVDAEHPSPVSFRPMSRRLSFFSWFFVSFLEVLTWDGKLSPGLFLCCRLLDSPWNIQAKDKRSSSLTFLFSN